jgi:hypothetical protein
MPCVKIEYVRSLRVENKSDRPLTLLLLLPHLSGHVVTVAKIIAEALALTV